MDQMIFCATAMVALRWWTSVASWRMVKDREYHLVTNEGPLTSEHGPALSKVQNRRVRHD